VLHHVALAAVAVALLHAHGVMHDAIHHALFKIFQPEFRFFMYSLPCFQVARPQLSEEEKKKRVKELQVPETKNTF
jgi:hypothetical protein